MAEERDTKSFKISGSLLGYILCALIGASGGAGVGSLRQAESAPVNTSQFVTREEAARSYGETRERLARIESKLDQLTTEADAPRRRR